MSTCNVTVPGLVEAEATFFDKLPSPWGSTMVASIPAVAELFGAFVAFSLSKGIPPKVQAALQNFSAGIIIAALGGEIFPLLTSKIEEAGSTAKTFEGLAGLLIGFMFALVFMLYTKSGDDDGGGGQMEPGADTVGAVGPVMAHPETKQGKGAGLSAQDGLTEVGVELEADPAAGSGSGSGGVSRTQSGDGRVSVASVYRGNSSGPLNPLHISAKMPQRLQTRLLPLRPLASPRTLSLSLSHTHTHAYCPAP